MDSSKDIIAGGLLHGANFSEWKAKTMAALTVRGLHQYVDGGIQDNVSDGTSEKRREDSKSAAAFITMLVDPSIIARLPESHDTTCSPAVLMQSLENMCHHFRFLYLPPELRNRIYQFALAGSTLTITDRTTDKYPAVTKVSRQMRNETLSLSYSLCVVKLAFKYVNQPVAKIAQKWILNVARENAQHLREIVVALPLQEPQSRRTAKVEIRLMLDKNHRLAIQFSEYLTNDAKAMLQRYIAAANTTCKIMGCKNDGRAFFFAFATNPDIWESRRLKVHP